MENKVVRPVNHGVDKFLVVLGSILFFVHFLIFDFIFFGFPTMDPEEPLPTRRKVESAPKAPSSKESKFATTKTEEDGEQSGEAQSRSPRLNESPARCEPEALTKSSEGSSSPLLRTSGVNKGEHSDKSSGSWPEVFANEQNDEYKGPWDYDNSYCPTTLPLRRPYSGDPALLDAEEFGEDATSKVYDENTVNPAAELELSEESEPGKMILFKFPPLPSLLKKVDVQELPEGGYMGKMRVYKNGSIKLKLGETLFDVSPGTNCVCPRDVVAMNTAEKHCCFVGELVKTAVVTPHIDSIDLKYS